MIDNYLSSLKKGLEKNKIEFLKLSKLTEEELKE
jgi:hypothetical protein